MAFAVPTFNLVCDIYNGPWSTKTLRSSPDCNLSLGRRVQQQFLANFSLTGTGGAASLQMDLLLPKGTDLRDGFQGFPNDIIEVPSGSGRWYEMMAWDDVGKGFANEYRLAVISKIGQVINAVAFPGLFWPTPTP